MITKIIYRVDKFSEFNSVNGLSDEGSVAEYVSCSNESRDEVCVRERKKERNNTKVGTGPHASEEP